MPEEKSTSTDDDVKDHKDVSTSTILNFLSPTKTQLFQEKQDVKISNDHSRHSVTYYPDENQTQHMLYGLIYSFRRQLGQKMDIINKVSSVIFLVAYLTYFAYCMYRKFGDEPSLRLLILTIIVVVVCGRKTLRYVLKNKPRSPLPPWKNKLCKKLAQDECFRKILTWSLYALSSGGTLVFIMMEIALKHPTNLISLIGLFVFILIGFFISIKPEKINWHTVYCGMQLQFWLAVFIQRTYFGSSIFKWMADRILEFLLYTDKGCVAVFGQTYMEHRFVFQVMPTLIFFTCAIYVLYYFGIIQVLIAETGRFMSFFLKTSPIESVIVVVNIFLSLTEAPVLIRPFINDVTASELFTIMTGGFASIAGHAFFAFTAFGAPADHVLTASVMSAPAALSFAKLIFPDDRPSNIQSDDAYTVTIGKFGSVLDALSKGAEDGLMMVGLVVANLLIFIAVLEFLDQTMLWFTEQAGLEGVTFTYILGYLFYPLTYLMGFERQDCLKMARLLGIKVFTTSQIGYTKLGEMITNSNKLSDYLATTNGSWEYVGENVLLNATNTTLIGGVISKRSGVLATYMLCGLSNLGAIGITIGILTALAPARAKEVTRYVSLALLAGNMANFATACVAGLLYINS